MECDHEVFSMVILPILMIQGAQLSYLQKHVHYILVKHQGPVVQT